MAQWLLKTEPSTFSIDDLEKKSVGEEAFFYHSSTEEKGIAGLCNVVREAYPDDSQFDPNSKYFDPRSTPEAPRWWMPDVGFVRKFPRVITLSELRTVPGLEQMVLLNRSRLSVQPVAVEEWQIILQLAEQT